MSSNKPGLGIRILNKAANLGGFSVVPSRVARGVDPYFKFFGNSVVWGKWDMDKYIDRGYLKNAGLYSIVNRITSVSAQAAETLRVYKVKNKAKAAKYKAWTGERATKESALSAMMLKNDAFEIDDTHPFNAILQKPNQWQGMNEFLQTSIGFKLLTGNRFIFLKTLDIGANAGRPVELYNLPPQHMNIVPGEGLWDVSGYELQLDRIVKLPVELIIHSRYWNPEFDTSRSHMWGLSPLKAAGKNLDRSYAAEERATAMLQNAGAAGILYSKEISPLTPEQAGALKKKINEEILGVDNAGKIALANGDMGYINFAMSAVEMSLLEQERFTFEVLCNIYKVPPGLFMASANATDNNIAAWNRQLVTQACLPALADVRDDLNKIIGLYGGAEYYVDYDINIFPEMQEDQNKLATILNLSPYLTYNEKRIVRGYDEDMQEPMMNRYLVPTGLTDISQLDPEKIQASLDAAEAEQDDFDKQNNTNNGKDIPL